MCVCVCVCVCGRVRVFVNEGVRTSVFLSGWMRAHVCDSVRVELTCLWGGGRGSVCGGGGGSVCGGGEGGLFVDVLNGCRCRPL